MEETAAPFGYQVLGEIGTLTVTNERQITFKQKGEAADANLDINYADGKFLVTLPEVVNQKIPVSLDLKVTKVAKGTETQLKGAVFTLTGPNLTQPEEKLTGDDGSVSFGNLGPGTYTLTETSPPPGFLLANPASWSFTIAADGKLADESSFSLEDGLITKTVSNQLNKFALIVNKTDETEEPLTGAQFKLTCPDNNYDETIGPDEQLSEFIFTGLSPGTYTLEETHTPADYFAHKKIYTVIIAPDGTVSFDADTEQDQFSVDLANNQITLTVVNYPREELPRTGGSGWLSYFILGGMVMLVPLWSAWRKGQEVSGHEK